MKTLPSQPVVKLTRSSAGAERLRDAPCHYFSRIRTRPPYDTV